MELKPRCSPLCLFLKEALGNQICCVGNRHRTNTKSLTRYLWKMTCCLPLHRVQRTDAKLSSHILHTGQRTVKLRRISLKNMWPLCEVKVTVKSNQTPVMQPLSDIFTLQLHTQSASRHPVYFGQSSFMNTADPCCCCFSSFLFPKRFHMKHSAAVWYLFLWHTKRSPLQHLAGLKINLLNGHNKGLHYFSSKGHGNSLNIKQEL